MHLEQQALEKKQAVTLYAMTYAGDSFEKTNIIAVLPLLILLCNLVAGCSYFNE